MVQSRKRSSKSKDKSGNAESENLPDRIPERDSFRDLIAYTSIFKEVQDYSMILMDPSGKVLSWNKGAERIQGYAASEIVGTNCRIFYPEEDKKAGLPEKLLEEARNAGRAVAEGWQVRKDGRRYWATISLTALHSEDGSVRDILKVTDDLTDKRIAEDSYSNFVEELKLKNEDLEKREERYHKMIAEVPDYAIILLDTDGTILDWNRGAEKLKGYTADEILHKSFRLFYPREEKEAGLPERLLEEARKQGSITHEGWRLRKDGNRFWGNVTITALHGKQGEIIGFSKLTRDFTEKKVAEDRVGIAMEQLRQVNDQLRASEERYHQMIAEVQDYAIILLSADGEIENWNTGAEYIKGYKAHEIIGKNFRIFYPEKDRAAHLPESLLSQAIKYGKATHEGWRLRKDGTRFWGSVVITALHNSKGDVIGFTKLTRDLTERKAAEDQLRTTAAQVELKNKTLERLNEELSSFTHVASHDMKEPLRKIHTFATRMEAINFEPVKSREYLDKIKASAVGMRNLIDDLLAYSQVSNDQGGTFQENDLNDVLQSVMSDLEIVIQEKRAVIDYSRLPVVRGIAYQLHQLFLNLLSNATKFSKPNEYPQISIRADVIKGPGIPGASPDVTNRYHHISVADNGIGFSHQYSDKIFEAFHRLHPKDVFSGSGIGLAIVKRIIDNHNGIISAEGNPGTGAVFHLYLPV